MTKVTDEMIDGAILAQLTNGSENMRRDMLRNVTLRNEWGVTLAALLPPPKPEIVVTEEMKRAGAIAYNDRAQQLGYAPAILQEQMAAAYRAMYRARPKPICGELEDGA